MPFGENVSGMPVRWANSTYPATVSGSYPSSMVSATCWVEPGPCGEEVYVVDGPGCGWGIGGSGCGGWRGKASGGSVGAGGPGGSVTDSLVALAAGCSAPVAQPARAPATPTASTARN